MPETNAVTPNNLDFLKFIKEARADKKTSHVEQEDIELATIANAAGWERFKSFMRQRKARLLDLKGFDITGADYVELGKLFFFANLVGEEIETFIARVENARTVAEAENGK